MTFARAPHATALRAPETLARFHPSDTLLQEFMNLAHDNKATGLISLAIRNRDARAEAASCLATVVDTGVSRTFNQIREDGRGNMLPHQDAALLAEAIDTELVKTQKLQGSTARLAAHIVTELRDTLRTGTYLQFDSDKQQLGFRNNVWQAFAAPR